MNYMYMYFLTALCFGDEAWVQGVQMGSGVSVAGSQLLDGFGREGLRVLTSQKGSNHLLRGRKRVPQTARGWGWNHALEERERESWTFCEHGWNHIRRKRGQEEKREGTLKSPN